MITFWSIRTILIAAVIAIGCLPVQRADATENDPGVWTIFSTTGSFGDDDADNRWIYWFDAQARYFDIGSGVNQWLVRPAVGYEIRDGVNAWVGYARFRSRNRSGNVTDEDRYWQQVDWRAGHWRNGRITMRTRLEQRSVSSGDDMGLVLRFMTKYVRPFATDADKSLIIGIEPFVNLKDTDWGSDKGLAQNRLSVGMGWSVSNDLALEASYMNQYIWVDGGADRVNHLAMLAIKAKF